MQYLPLNWRTPVAVILWKSNPRHGKQQKPTTCPINRSQIRCTGFRPQFRCEVNTQMNALVEAIQDVVIAEPETETQPDPTQPDDSRIEDRLAEEISTLWSDHVRLSASRKVTSKELRQIRASLAGRLAAMKSLLSHPGRSGEWRGWLRERGIPRSTADRLVDRHAETLCSHDENVPSGAISEPAKPTAEGLAETVWSSLKKVLTTSQSVVEFIGCIAKISGVPHEWRDGGLMIFNPVTRAADELSGSISAPEPAPQPSDGGDANPELPAAEITTATLTTEQAAAVADADSGHVV